MKKEDMMINLLIEVTELLKDIKVATEYIHNFVKNITIERLDDEGQS